jgi:hypothetical protein
MIRIYKLIFLILMSYPNTGFSQCAIPIIDGTSTVGLIKVVKTNKTKADAFRVVRTWILKKYPSYSSIIQIEDLEGGQISYKATAPILYGRFKSMRFNVTVDTKDYKYRCSIDGLELLSRSSESYKVAGMFDFTAESDGCEAVRQQFGSVEQGIREAMTSTLPLVQRQSF